MIKQLILVGLFFSIIKGQIISTIDTISALPYTTEIKLDHELIVDTSFSILEQDLNSIKYSLDPIKGILFINNQKDKIQSIIIKYDYYSISLPIKIGPKMLNLPQIDSLIINKDLKNIIKKLPNVGPEFLRTAKNLTEEEWKDLTDQIKKKGK